MNSLNRRSFIKTSILGGVVATTFSPGKTFASLIDPEQSNSRVAITTGGNRADLVFRALQPFAKQIRQDIGNRHIVLKPNNVAINIPLCATHVDTLEGILEFLKSIKKLENIVIAESSGGGSTLEGFDNYGYYRLVNKYPVKMVDLDQEEFKILNVFDQKDFRPHPVRVSGLILSPDSYIVSVARMKTHDSVVVTLSLKNIVFGAPVKDPGFNWGKTRKEGTKSDKPIVHGGGYMGHNFNLYSLASRLHPHLAVIDGFEGMQGNGPTNGTAVDHKVCVVSTDWLAADRVAVELMGVDFAKVGYLNYCAQTGLGIADLSKIEIIGERISDHIIPYKLHDSIEKQLIWMTPA